MRVVPVDPGCRGGGAVTGVSKAVAAVREQPSVVAVAHGSVQAVGVVVISSSGW